MSYANRIGDYHSTNSGPNNDDTGVRRMVETLATLITGYEDGAKFEYTDEETTSIRQETHRWLTRHLWDRCLADREYQEGIDYLRNRIGNLRQTFWKKFLHRVFMKHSLNASWEETAINDKMNLYQRMYQSFRFAMRSAMNNEIWEDEAME